MKRITLILTVAILFFSGCANNGLAINSLSGNKVDRYFKRGTIIKSKKCIVDERLTAIVTGAGSGALLGAVAGMNKHTTKKALIGGVIGGVIGGLIGKEVAAYQLTILSNNNNRRYTGFSRMNIPVGSLVEFTVTNNQIKNLNIIRR